MINKNHPWENIFAREGRIFTEPFPAFSSVAQKFTQHQSRRILDLGCGNGRHVVALMKMDFEVIGFDISPTGLNLTHEWLEEENLSANLVCGDGRYGLPFKDDSFDGIISTQVIHHALLAEIHFTVSEIWRVMTEGGIAFVTVAGKTHEDTAYQEIEPRTFVPLDGSEQGLPHHIFAEEDIKQAFDRFQILEINYRDKGRVLAIWINKVVKKS